MKAKEYFKKIYGRTIEEAHTDYNGHDMVKFAESYHQAKSKEERPTLLHGEVMEIVRGKCVSDAAAKAATEEICQLAPKRVSEVPDDIREFIGQVVYDGHGQMIFRGADKNNLKQFLDVRGWGAIQNMGFKAPAQAEAFQDKIGQWVTDVINDRLQSLTPEPKEQSDGKEGGYGNFSEAQTRRSKARDHLGGWFFVGCPDSDLLHQALDIAAGLAPEQEEGGKDEL